MNRDSFIVHANFSKDVQTKFHTLIFKVTHKEKVIVLINDELGAKIMIEYVWLRPKINSYLKDDSFFDKNTKSTKKVYDKARN